MDHYEEFQKLQELLNDPKYKPFINVAKKVVHYTSVYLIWALQTIQSIVLRYPQISDWLGYLFSLYMVYQTLKRTVRMVRSSGYLIFLLLGIYVWRRGISQVVLMDMPYLIDRLKKYVKNLPNDSKAHRTFAQDISSPVLELYYAIQDLF